MAFIISISGSGVAAAEKLANVIVQYIIAHPEVATRIEHLFVQNETVGTIKIIDGSGSLASKWKLDGAFSSRINSVIDLASVMFNAIILASLMVIIVKDRVTFAKLGYLSNREVTNPFDLK